MLHNILRLGAGAALIVATTVGMQPAAAQSRGIPKVASQSQNQQTGRTTEFGLTIGGSWSDNITLLPGDGIDGVTGSAGMNLGFHHERRRLKTDIDVNARYEHYIDNEFDSEVLGGLNGSLVFGLVPKRVEWFVQDSFGQVRISPFAATTPDNREDINYFTTGPDITLALTRSTAFRLSGRYSNVNYELTDLDANRFGGTLALIRGLNSPRSISFQAGAERVEFDTMSFTGGYDYHYALVRYQARGSRTDLTADIGYGAIADGGESSDGVQLQLSATRQLSASSSLRLDAGSRFSDAGELFRSGQDSGGVSIETGAALASRDAFESRYAIFGWDFSRNRTGFGLSIRGSNDTYEQTRSLDRKRFGYEGYFTRRLSPVLGLRLHGAMVNEKFDLSGFDSDELRLGVALIRQVGATLQWTAQFDRIDRDSSLVATEYQENRISLFLTWTPLAR